MDRPAVADYPAGAQLPSRVIDDFELVWMLRGEARLTGDHARPLSPGELLLLPPGLPHGFDWDRTRPSRHGYVHFGPEHFRASPPITVSVRTMTADDPLEGLCRHLVWLGRLDDDSWHEHATRSLEFLLDLYCSGRLPATDVPPALPSAVVVAVEHLRSAWPDLPLRRIGVDELAGAVFVSRSHLGRLFGDAFGLSPGPALEQLRCARAEALLRRTDLTVEHIARQCGFADVSHFSHRFAAIHGVSPRAYRAAAHPATSVLDHPGVRRLAHLLWG